MSQVRDALTTAMHQATRLSDLAASARARRGTQAAKVAEAEAAKTHAALAAAMRQVARLSELASGADVEHMGVCMWVVESIPMLCIWVCVHGS